MKKDRVIVIGAGIGGLAAALDLTCQGADVTVLERANEPGGKLRQIGVDGTGIDAGPTVFTMRWVFEALFARAGETLADFVPMRPATILARHGWPDGSNLDLCADNDRTAEAIARMSGRHDAEGYRRFAAEAKRIYDTLEGPFIRNTKPSLPRLIARVARNNPLDLWAIQPYASLWRRLGKYFRDPRLRQLFARYATYNGSSPFRSPATLMLIAHVERQGVWLVDGGMHRLAAALATLIRRRGGEVRYETHVAEIVVEDGRACAVRLASGEQMIADAVISNGDVNAVAAGAFGAAASKAARPLKPRHRSLSAMTWALRAQPDGFPLVRHNVFFPQANYAREFEDIFNRRTMPRTPAIYVCAQDRGGRDGPRAAAPERLFCVMNAPPVGDVKCFDQGEMDRCTDSMLESLRRCGLRIEPEPGAMTIMTPTDFHRMYPGTGGAIYGRASYGWIASFLRPSARSRIPGLYFAGGSTHPGAGLPMAALSGRLAAQAVAADLALQGRFHPVAMPGGMSMA